MKTKLKEKGTAALSSEAQESFLKAVGMISPDIVVDTIQVLSDEELDILSCAMIHIFIEEEGLNYPYLSGLKCNKSECNF